MGTGSAPDTHLYWFCLSYSQHSFTLFTHFRLPDEWMDFQEIPASKRVNVCHLPEAGKAKLSEKLYGEKPADGLSHPNVKVEKSTGASRRKQYSRPKPSLL